MEDTESIRQAASLLGKAGVAKRKAKMGEAEFKAHLQAIAKRPRPRGRVAHKKKTV